MQAKMPKRPAETAHRDSTSNGPKADDPAYSAFFLIGPTAVGKSAVAQLIAEWEGWDILSADSMPVYKGMDVGTAKPLRSERGRVRYWGLDLVSPDSAFSVGDYIASAETAFRTAAEAGHPLLVVGGTGLYVKCLTEGLAELPEADRSIRAAAEAVFAAQGIAGLQDVLRKNDSERFERLADKNNPRRLIRAIELAHIGTKNTRTWTAMPAVPLVGLRMESDILRQRIETRVEKMYSQGLLDEVGRLRRDYPQLSATALQAIGYAEALALLDKSLSLAEAMQRTAARTRQLAKRQMTWFRHQANVEWIDVGSDERIEDIAVKVTEKWKQHGPTPVRFRS